MNSARNGVIDLFDAVGGEEHDSLVILQLSKEYRDHCITMNVAGSPFLKRCRNRRGVGVIAHDNVEDDAGLGKLLRDKEH